MIPFEDTVINALRAANEPLTSEQILQGLPAASHFEPKKLAAKLKTVLARPEVGHPTRGKYLYLPARITGAAFRLPLLADEAPTGRLLFLSDLTFALWFRHVDYGRAPRDVTATCELPDGTRSRLTVCDVLRSRRGSFGSYALVQAGPELYAWLSSLTIAAGDSLSVRLLDGEKSICAVTLERPADRDSEQVLARNRELADAAVDILRNEMRGRALFAHDLTGWLLSRGAYHLLPPPDPLDIILLGDPRFTVADDGKFALATSWEWTRESEIDFSQAGMEAFHLEFTGRPFSDSDWKEEGAETHPWDRRRVFGVHLEEELEPWLTAVGRRSDSPDSEPPAARREPRVFRLRAWLSGRKSEQRVLELEGDDTLAELDELLRDVFGHDAMDHMSGFSVRTGGGPQAEWLATINPFGGIEEGDDYALADLRMEPGAQITYVYDFGDWIEHTIQLVAVTAPDPDAVYPRLMDENTRP